MIAKLFSILQIENERISTTPYSFRNQKEDDKHLNNSKTLENCNLPKCNQNSMIEGEGRFWRSDITILTNLKISGNVIRDGKTETKGGGLKFPSTTKSLT